MSNLQHYYLGCPIWSNADWVGDFFTADARPKDFLAQYGSVFNTVEGNSTFYGLPKPVTIERWRDDTPANFRFCCKFPRTISHDRKLAHAQVETTEFLNRMTPLADRLGPLFLQLPPSFSGAALAGLKDYLDSLSNDFNYAVEVRHFDFFAKGEAERELNRTLHERGMDRVILDSRALFSAPAKDEITHETQQRKPRVPVHVIALGQYPMVRFIGHPEIDANRSFLQPWVNKIVDWINEDQRPYIFTHTPDNHYAPHLAQVFHTMLQERLATVDDLPDWPINKSTQSEQVDLF